MDVVRFDLLFAPGRLASVPVSIASELNLELERNLTVSVGSGLGSEPTSFKPHKIGYLAKDRLPYFAETPTAPKPFWCTRR